MSAGTRVAVLGGLCILLALVPIGGLLYVATTRDVSSTFWPVAGLWIAGLIVGGVAVVVLAAFGQVFPGRGMVTFRRENMDRVRQVALPIGMVLALFPVVLLGIPDFRPYVIGAGLGFMLPLSLVGLYQAYRGVGTD